jgi:hypothetical protein
VGTLGDSDGEQVSRSSVRKNDVPRRVRKHPARDVHRTTAGNRGDYLIIRADRGESYRVHIDESDRRFLAADLRGWCEGGGGIARADAAGRQERERGD